MENDMREDTQAYRHERDVVGRFIDGECIVGEGFTSPKKLTYLYFKEWAEEAGEHYTMTQVEFNEKMLSKFEDGRSKGGRFWKSFKLKRSEGEFESRRMMEDVPEFGMGSPVITRSRVPDNRRRIPAAELLGGRS
jgi:phage/plasmid-associated DNA primase